jgi:hypothetical protein
MASVPVMGHKSFLPNGLNVYFSSLSYSGTHSGTGASTTDNISGEIPLWQSIRLIQGRFGQWCNGRPVERPVREENDLKSTRVTAVVSCGDRSRNGSSK